MNPLTLPKIPPLKHEAEFLTIGDELLKGSTLNTNARFLGAELTALGFKVTTQVSCRDEKDAICAKLGEALSRSDLVILSGGLGPTPDDVTRDAVAKFFGVRLQFSKSQYDEIIKLYGTYHRRRVPAIVRREALFPQNSVPLINRHGVALGFYIGYDGKLIIVLPGVPRELERMYHECVRPLILRYFPKRPPRFTLTVHLAGISEPEVMRRLRRDFFDVPFEFGIYPYPGEIILRLQAGSGQIIRGLQKKIRDRLTDFVTSDTGAGLGETIGRLLTKRKQTLAVAESCTGGRLASEITQTAGASRYFKGGVTVYSNESKEKCLGVPRDLLKRKGAVSAEVARALAAGVRKEMNASYGIGLTGIAGPSGGTPQKPVGTVFMALASRSQTKAWKELFHGDRTHIQTRAVKKALERLWRQIR